MITYEELHSPMHRFFVALIYRAARDAMGYTFGAPAGTSDRVRAEAYEWLHTEEAAEFAAFVGIPARTFKRNLAAIPDPR